jgi:sugar (pentulose or hexulose) kinase
MGDILIGIDLGTTVFKAAAFDARSGKALAQSSRRLDVILGRDGSREQSATGIDRAMKAVFADLRKQLGPRWRHAAGIGLSAQGGSAVIADRRTGKPLTSMMLWNDARQLRYLPRIMEDKPPAFWEKHTLRNEPGRGLGRLLWLRETRPSLLSKDNLYAGAGEYCYFKMTGRWQQDAGNALQIGCYNTPKRGLDQKLLDVVDLPLSFVAPMREGHETHPLSEAGARFLGLSAGIPVAGPYMDHEAGYLSATGISRRPLQFSLGTAWVANFIVPEKAEWSSSVQLVLPAILGKGWLVVQPLLTGNVSWDWGLQELVDTDHAAAIRQLDGIFSRELLPPEGLAALPWFNMPNPLQTEALGAGGFFGMSPLTQKHDLLRALAEVRDKKVVDSVVLGGGASNGTFFRTLLAALFAPLPVRWQCEKDLSGPRGALYPFSRAAANAQTRPVPKPAAKLQKRILGGFESYMLLFERIYGDSPYADGVVFGKKA